MFFILEKQNSTTMSDLKNDIFIEYKYQREVLSNKNNNKKKMIRI